MLHSQECLLLGVTLSSTALSAIHTLHTELNTFLKSSSKKDPREKSNTDTVQNLFRIVNLKLRGKVDDENFTTLFKKWSKTKGCYLGTSKFMDVEQRNEFSTDDILSALRTVPLIDSKQYTNFLTDVVQTLNTEYNAYLQRVAEIGLNYIGQSIKALDQETVTRMDQIFALFDPKGTGSISIDRIFFLYLALLCSRPNPSFQVNQATFIGDINLSFDCFLKKSGCFQGRITSRQFKTYLLYNSLSTKTALEPIYQASIMVLELGKQLNEELQISNSESLFPNLLTLAIKKTLPKANLSDLKNNTLDLQLVCHFFLNRFFSFIHEHQHYQGLNIIKKTILSQDLLKDFHDYYLLNPHTVYWHFHLAQTFLTIIQNYAHISTEVLQYSVNWLLSHNNSPFPQFRNNILIIPEAKINFSGFKSKTSSTQEETEKHWNSESIYIDILNVEKSECYSPSNMSSNQKREENSLVKELKEQLHQNLGPEIESYNPRTMNNSGTRQNFFEASLKNYKSISKDQSVSPPTGTSVERPKVKEPCKVSHKHSLSQKFTEKEEKMVYSRDKTSIQREASPEILKRTNTPASSRDGTEKGKSYMDRSLSPNRSSGIRNLRWQEIENLKNNNRNALIYEKKELEEMSKRETSPNYLGNRFGKVKGIMSVLEKGNQLRSELGDEIENSRKISRDLKQFEQGGNSKGLMSMIMNKHTENKPPQGESLLKKTCEIKKSAEEMVNDGRSTISMVRSKR